MEDGGRGERKEEGRGERKEEEGRGGGRGERKGEGREEGRGGERRREEGRGGEGRGRKGKGDNLCHQMLYGVHQMETEMIDKLDVFISGGMGDANYRHGLHHM